jgi:glycerol-3-phosphate dehydrogenase (NAD(P)+)
VRVHGQPAVEAQEQVLAVGVHRADLPTRQSRRPAIETVARLGREDLLRQAPAEHRCDASRRVVDRVALWHPSTIAQGQPAPALASAPPRLPPATLAQRMASQPELTPPTRSPRVRALSPPGARRATVIGAGSFGTALAVLLTRAGLRTTLQTRTAEQTALIAAQRENRQYLPGVQLPSQLRVEAASAGVARADYVFLAVPSSGLGEVIERLDSSGLGGRTAVVSVAKGLVGPHGTAPTSVLSARFGPDRVACVGGPAHAQEMVHAGAALVAASAEEQLARSLAQVFARAGVVCELSNDPIGVELAGAAKNAAALAAGATEAQGLNAAGAAAGHIFAEVWRYAEGLGARPESMIGLAGAGDLLATALAHESRNRRAGELLAAGVPAAEIPVRIGQAVEALESVPLLARALQSAGVSAPVTSALARLIAGELPLEEWVALVRATVPPPARWRRRVGRHRSGFWRRVWHRLTRGA